MANFTRGKDANQFDPALAFQSAEAFDEIARVLYRAAMQGHKGQTALNSIAVCGTLQS